MFKKLMFPMTLALLLSPLVGSVAFAQANQPPASKLNGGWRVLGQVSTVQSSQIAVKTRAGAERSIAVDEKTGYRGVHGELLTLQDIKAGNWIAVIMRLGAGNQPVARLVVVLPSDFDPSQRFGVRARGKVTSVDGQAQKFTLHSLQGVDLTFSVNAATQYWGQVKSLADLQKGMVAGVGAVQQSDGSNLALVVLARIPFVRHTGTVLSVDAAANQFTLHTLKGEDVIIAVDANTRFRSRDHSIQGIQDLQPQMVAYVTARQAGDGSLLAVMVAAGDKDDLPRFDLRIAGKVTQVGQDSFSLQAADGQQVTLLLSQIAPT